MKRTIILLSIAFVFSFTAQAQEQSKSRNGVDNPTEKGSLLLGSDMLLASFTNYMYHNHVSKSYEVGFGPRAGYFILNDLALGLWLNGTLYGSKDVNAYNYSGGLFSRYYFGKATDLNGMSNRTRFFVEAGVGFGKEHYIQQTDSVSSWESAGSYSYYVMPGINYFLNSHIALEGGLNYSRSGVFNDGFTYERISLSLGARIFLRKNTRSL